MELPNHPPTPAPQDPPNFNPDSSPRCNKLLRAGGGGVKRVQGLGNYFSLPVNQATKQVIISTPGDRAGRSISLGKAKGTGFGFLWVIWQSQKNSEQEGTVLKPEGSHTRESPLLIQGNWSGWLGGGVRWPKLLLGHSIPKEGKLISQKIQSFSWEISHPSSSTKLPFEPQKPTLFSVPVSPLPLLPQGCSMFSKHTGSLAPYQGSSRCSPRSDHSPLSF